MTNFDDFESSRPPETTQLSEQDEDHTVDTNDDEPPVDSGPDSIDLGAPVPPTDMAANDATTSDPTEADASVSTPEIGCEPRRIFQQNGCLNCHGEQPQAGLNLGQDNLAQSMLNTRSADCPDRLLIDPITPEYSLLLQVVGAGNRPEGDQCNIVMPEISNADKQCLTQWINESVSEYEPPDEDFEITPLRSSLQKVKTLLRGDSVTEAELGQVANAPDEQSAMRTLYRSWSTGDLFDSKMMAFLKVALQQQLQDFQTDQFNRLRTGRAVTASIRRVIEDSFVRTALHIVNSNQSFANVTQTQTWMVTTANLVLLLYGDQSDQERQTVHTVFSTPNGRPTGLRQQINRKAWFLDRDELGECELSQQHLLNFLMGAILRRFCVNHDIGSNVFRFGFADMHLNEDDFNDWRLVTLDFQPNADDGRIPFYDIRRLRTADTVITRIPRVGFFSTNAFFENWLTNVDNQFRVVVNQALLVGLHTKFLQSDQTAPYNDGQIDGEHAEPNQPCYGCHKNIDPMRAYFSKSYNVNYQRPFGEGDNARILTGARPSFAYKSVRNRGGDLRRFGRLLGEHPQFASAWVQKLCLFANSTRCNERDPIFRTLVDQFRSNNYNLKELIVALFASPLVSGRSETLSNGSLPLISISRRDHLCASLSLRTGRPDICSVNRIRNIIGLIPNDDFARGADDFTQPTLPNPIYLTAADAVCKAVANTVVRNSDAIFPLGEPDRAISAMANTLMGLVAVPERAAEVSGILTDHYDQALADNATRQDALRSTFVSACLTPDVLGLGL